MALGLLAAIAAGVSGCGATHYGAQAPHTATVAALPRSTPVTGPHPAPATVLPRSATAPPGVAALVNGERVPAWEFNALLLINSNGAITSTAQPAAPAVRARTAQQAVDEALLNAYAAAHGLAVAPGAVDARLQAYRLQSGAGFAASLARLGVNLTQFRRMVERNLNALAVTRHVVDGINAPAQRVQVAQVIVATAQQALAVRAQMVRGVDAALLAVRESSDPTMRRLAGQLPPLTRAQAGALYGPAWRAAAFGLPPGAVSQPLLVHGGWAVLEVVERLPAPAVVTRALDRFVAGLRRSARISIYVH